MRKLVTVARVEEIRNIDGADLIVAYRVRNWWVVDQKDRYKVGDHVLYYEIDSFLPIKEEFEFLRKSSYKKLPNESEGFRLRTIRLKGQVSQGLITPIPDTNPDLRNEGDDWTEILGVTKYEPPIPSFLSGLVKGSFPSFIQKTDEERIQNIRSKDFDSWRSLDFYATEKVDGSSVTFYHNNRLFGVCSRNLELSNTENNAQWRIATDLDLKNKLCDLGLNIALQGEIYGNGIQGNKYKKNNKNVAFFTIFDIDKQCKVSHTEFIDICKTLKIPTVPIIIAHFRIEDKTVEDLLRTADGNSVICPEVLREGLVMRDYSNQISFKAISNNWLIKYNKD